MVNEITWKETPKEDEKKIQKRLEKGRKAMENRKKIREMKEDKAKKKLTEEKKEGLTKREKMVQKINKQNVKKLKKKKENESKETPQVGLSTENEKWRQKRVKRYNDSVWRGWRETDGVKYSVTGSGSKSASKKK